MGDEADGEGRRKVSRFSLLFIERNLALVGDMVDVD